MSLKEEEVRKERENKDGRKQNNELVIFAILTMFCSE